MRRLAVAALAALALLVAAPAQAVTPPPATSGYLTSPLHCATRVDYNRVVNGMTRARVAIILKNKGITVYYHAIPKLPYWTIWRIQKYPVCTRAAGYILVTYLNDRVRAKTARW